MQNLKSTISSKILAEMLVKRTSSFLPFTLCSRLCALIKLVGKIDLSVFVTGKYFQPSLIFAAKARSTAEPHEPVFNNLLRL